MTDSKICYHLDYPLVPNITWDNKLFVRCFGCGNGYIVKEKTGYDVPLRSVLDLIDKMREFEKPVILP